MHCFTKPFFRRKKVLFTSEISESSWFGFSFIIKNSSKIDRNKFIKYLIENNIEVRPIVTGNFLNNPAMKYFDYTVHKSLKNAELLGKNGFFVGNSHQNLEKEITYLHNKLETIKFDSCGINGIFSTSISNLKARERVQKMNDSISHRGPDAFGHFFSNNIALGHRRLSIIDLDERSNQPMKFGDYIIVFNGEIFNYKELKNIVKADYKTNSDTEVIIKLKLKVLIGFWIMQMECLHLLFIVLKLNNYFCAVTDLVLSLFLFDS